MHTLAIDVRPVPEQITEWRTNDPQLVALRQGTRELTFEELDRRATQFSSYLQQNSVVPGGTVAICMERSIDWIVAALGILRAGAAYVPLDAAWPDARLRFTIADSHAKVIIARSALLDRLNLDAHGIDPRRDAALISAASQTHPVTIDPESIAYVIYTSGSTGVPKGVEITHANLNHLIRWHRSAFDVTGEDRAGHLAGLGFDAAVWEIWPHLCSGATLCLADDEVRSSPDLLQQWILRERLTIAFVPTVHAGPLTTLPWPLDTPLRFLLTGGDVLRQAPPQPLPFQLVNNYGPTECTVVATSTIIEPRTAGLPPIGRAILGASVYLLDEHGQPVPDGTPGEIYVGGTGVGRGYRNLPELSSQVFLPDPFAGDADARMYRTGDRGVRRPDGEIEFRGRLDRQTKIRGQRIELDEIGNILSHHPAIDYAAAMVRATDSGDSQLVAYVLPKDADSLLSANDLQRHLLLSLPDYMVPSVFMRLRSLPISANGKLDLSRLSEHSDLQLVERTSARVPVSAVEQKLLENVREVLENNAVTLEDNFFLAGGHSLLGMQLVMRLRQVFGVDLALQQLFDAPTSARLAVTLEIGLEEARLITIWSEILGRHPIKTSDDFFALGGTPKHLEILRQRIDSEFGRTISVEQLSENPTIRRQAELTMGKRRIKPALPPGVLSLQPNGTRTNIFWVHYLSVSLAKVVGEDQPFLSVMVTPDDVASLGDSPTLPQIAECLLHKIIRTQPVGPYTLGGFCLGGILAYEIASQMRAANLEVSLLVLLDTPNPTFIDSRHPLTPRLSNPRDMIRRVGKLGVKTTLVKVSDRILEQFAGPAIARTARNETTIAQQMIEAAASVYDPPVYYGRVLLLLASDKPSHVNFLPGWQSVVLGDLNVQYVDGHHDDLTRAVNVQSVADAITAHNADAVSAPSDAG